MNETTSSVRVEMEELKTMVGKVLDQISYVRYERSKVDGEIERLQLKIGKFRDMVTAIIDRDEQEFVSKGENICQ